MLRLISFGSGSWGNCYVLSDETMSVIIDCGISLRRIKRLFKDYGVNQSTLRAVLITHDHTDHIKAVGKISNEYCLPVYTTERIHKGIQTNIRTTTKVNAANVKKVTTDEAFCIGNFRITPFILPHDSTENVGYSIEHSDISFTIMTDIGTPTDNVAKYIRKSTHLVIESNYDRQMLIDGKYTAILKKRIMGGNGHLSNEQTGTALAENYHPELKKIWLCHLSEENNLPEKALQTVTEHLNKAGIDTEKDVEIQALKRKTPSGPFFL